MKASIFRPKRLVEKSVEKILRTHPAPSLLAPAKNAAPVEMLPINVLFSITYRRQPRPFVWKRLSPVRRPKAWPTVRVLHKD
jgi:hypothetical protein